MSREYRKWKIVYNPKPIGTTKHDYDAVHQDYDGEDTPGLCFTASTAAECEAIIDDMEEDK